MAAENKNSRRREVLRSADFFAGQIKSTFEKIDAKRRTRPTISEDFRAPYDSYNGHGIRFARRLSGSTYRPVSNSAEAHPIDMSTRSILELHTLKARNKRSVPHIKPDAQLYTLDNALLDSLATSKTWPGRELMAEPSDLVCFLAGCSPGRSQCEHRRGEQEPSKVAPNQTDGAPDTSSGAIEVASRSSTVSFDQFPHATQWLNTQRPAALTEANIAIATNFSLPGPKVVPPRKASLIAAPAIPDALETEVVKPSVPATSTDSQTGCKDEKHTIAELVLAKFAKESESKPARSLQSSNPPSMLSRTSRTSAFRHALLKSSATESPIDNGLPIPPVLTAGVVLPELSTVQSKVGKNQESTELEPHMQPAEVEKASGSSISPVILSTKPDDIPTIAVQPSPSMQELPVSTPGSNTSDDSKAAYWGFVPAINEAVHGAVDAAVKIIVSEAISKNEFDKSKASKAYRRAVAESLAQAAEDVDTFLKRPSLWQDAEALHAHQGFLKQPCHRVTCLEDPSIEHCNTFSCSPAPSPTILKPALTWRGNDCAVYPHPSDQSLSGIELETVGHLGLPAGLLASHSFSSNGVHPNSKRAAVDVKTSQTPQEALPYSTSYKTLSLASHRSDRATGSVSSIGVEDDQIQPAEAQESLVPAESGNDVDHNSLSYLSIKESVKRRNTVKWLRDLLKHKAHMSQG